MYVIGFLIAFVLMLVTVKAIDKEIETTTLATALLWAIGSWLTVAILTIVLIKIKNSDNNVRYLEEQASSLFETEKRLAERKPWLFLSILNSELKSFKNTSFCNLDTDLQKKIISEYLVQTMDKSKKDDFERDIEKSPYFFRELEMTTSIISTAMMFACFKHFGVQEEKLSRILSDLASVNTSMIVTKGLNYGSTLNKIIDICTNFNNLPFEEKMIFSAKHNLHEPIVMDVIRALGKPSYYDEGTHEVIPEVPYSINDIRVSVRKLGEALSIDLSECIINADTIDRYFKRSANEALTIYNNTEATLIEQENLEGAIEYTEVNDTNDLYLEEKGEVDFEYVISLLEESDSDFPDDTSSTKIVLTSPYNTVPEVQSEKGLRDYLLRLSKLTRSDLCIELSNVLAAKHNLILLPSSINEFSEKQEKVTDLIDKAVAICIQEFGQDIIMNYGHRDISKFNELINTIDTEVAQEDLPPEKHGCKILNKLNQVLS